MQTNARLLYLAYFLLMKKIWWIFYDLRMIMNYYLYLYAYVRFIERGKITKKINQLINKKRIKPQSLSNI